MIIAILIIQLVALIFTLGLCKVAARADGVLDDQGELGFQLCLTAGSRGRVLCVLAPGLNETRG